jgi:nitrite reductase/ring-hydroxylating ferredoxin subunit
MSEIEYRVCTAADVPVNTIRRFEIDGRPIAIYNIDNVFYATDDTCTHGLASLAAGELDGDVVECNLHFGAFHVPTGKPVGAPCSVPLQVYRTEVHEGEVRIYRAAAQEGAANSEWVRIEVR